MSIKKELSPTMLMLIAAVGVASFCPWSIGSMKYFSSRCYKKINAGDFTGACAEIKRWVCDGGKDYRVRTNNCYGQIKRCSQESELACWERRQ